MNRLIIIGNGFDLASGLQSGYPSFILWYLKQCLNDNVNEENLYIYSKVNNSVVTFICEAETLTEFFIRLKRNEIRYNTQKETDTFLKEIVKESVIKNWVDIESLYINHLIKLKETKTQEELKKGLIVRLNNQLYSIGLKLEEYLGANLGKLENIDNDYSDKLKQLLFCENLEKLNFGNGDFNKSNTLILNFNYTNLTHQWAYEQENTTQINIHGELNNEENKIIFGYGDNTHHKYLELEQANDKEYLKNIKSMSYPLSNNYKKLLYFLNNGRIEGGDNIEHQPNFEVLIYGHSCGLSDRILLKTIFEHENCDGIHVAFYQNKNDYFDKTIEISRHFDKKDMFLEKLKPFNEKLIIPQIK